MRQPFDSLYSHGLIRVAVAVPRVAVADPGSNAAAIERLAGQASRQSASLVLFPELSISAYAIDDLLQQQALLEASLQALDRVVDASRTLVCVVIVGVPLIIGGALFNCAVAVYRGRILGITPKSYLPNYREFYEKRHFQPAAACRVRECTLLHQTVPVGADLVFEAQGVSGFSFHMEICEDLWVPAPPSSTAALAGATILTNLSASNITIGKSDYRHTLAAAQSGRCIAAYLYSAAGAGESTTDLAWDGHALIYENNHLLGETVRFHTEEQLLTADVDVEALLQDRLRSSSWQDSVLALHDSVTGVRRVGFDYEVPDGHVALQRAVARFPYVPADPQKRSERCFEAHNIQVSALVQRLQATGIGRIIIGVSGGLDSTHALIVAVKAVDRLGLARDAILACTMPGFATSERTLRNARALMKALGVQWREIDIRAACMQTFRDIGHPFADGTKQYDVTFENVQAGERTSLLFRLANLHDGLVLGTGDLSELALGWATYGVGDHMSHYAVNSSVPKTLIRHLIRWNIESGQFDETTSRILASVLQTEISPELVPGDENGDSTGEDSADGSPEIGPAQSTQSIIGPYDLQDFHLYYISRFGFAPSKVAYLAHHAWGDRYDLPTIKHWLAVFLQRFFATSQFKRSCMPNGPKVGSGGSLSPRGDWRAPSDSSAAAWLDELQRNVSGS
ncbi:MAG: NAD(+) synthase [Spirochaetaceae bacterium]|nr:MAG: NAD(+) synthase [Spirochaetaceae bacterium]